jgi:hypothetical protein
MTERKDSWYHQLIILFKDGQKNIFDIEMSPTGTLITERFCTPAEWTLLDFCKCPSCRLGKAEVYCPAALSLEETIMKFKDRDSFERVKGTAIDGAGRVTIVKSTLHEVGSVFVQLAVFSSGCPLGKRVRPLLRDARPFSTNKELLHYLMGMLLIKCRGDVEEVRRDAQRLFQPLHDVFANLARRIGAESLRGDAVQNAIVHLDVFAQYVSWNVDSILDEFNMEMSWD